MVSYWVQNRRDTASNWTSYNPVLRPGEIGHESDTNLSKMGDGVTPWRTLQYWNPSGAAPAALAKAVVTLAGGTLAVANILVTSSTIVRLSRQALGGTPGNLSVALTPGTGFTINSSSGSDTSKVYYEVVSY